jgi:GNAT superfamily N-acetyltransferase
MKHAVRTTATATTAGRLVALSLTPERWGDLERLFGPNGAYSNCWCTFQRVSGREFSAGCANRGAGNRALLRSLTNEGRQPGLIAYRDGDPVGWVSVGPRPEFGRILRSPIAKLDAEEKADASVWSIVCFYIPRRLRGGGIGRALVAEAVAHAHRAGARLVEAYPVDTAGARVPGISAYTGTVALFRRAGFRRRPSRGTAGRPVMQLPLERGRDATRPP